MAQQCLLLKQIGQKPVLEGGKHVKFNLGDIYVRIIGNKEDYTWIDKCNLRDKDKEEEEPQDIVYLVLKGVLKELAIEV